MKPFSQVRGPVKEILDELLADTAAAEDLIYRQFKEQVFSESDGFNIDTFEDFDVVGIALRRVQRMAPVFQGAVEKGDKFFLFRLGDLPDVVSSKDKIVDSDGNVYSVVPPIEKILDLMVTVTVDGP